MVRYQLSNGKTVLITIDQLIDMTDELEQQLLATNGGMEINDPFADLGNRDVKESVYDMPDLDLEDIPDEVKDEIKKDFEEDK